jgi:isopentenyl-diphosphate delta-isomerase
MSSSELITAIAEDGSLYPIGKLDAHIRNVRHLAISVFIIHEDRLLLQKRAAGKYHSGLLWANTCCSHPRWNETVEECAPRRLKEELGWTMPLTRFGEIAYSADVGGGLFENEIAHCFFAHIATDMPLDIYDPDEVAGLEWATLGEIDTALADDPGRFSQWFRIYMGEHRSMIEDAMHAPASFA